MECYRKFMREKKKMSFRSIAIESPLTKGFHNGVNPRRDISNSVTIQILLMCIARVVTSPLKQCVQAPLSIPRGAVCERKGTSKINRNQVAVHLKDINVSQHYTQKGGRYSPMRVLMKKIGGKRD